MTTIGVEAFALSDLRWRYKEGNVRMSQAKVSEHVYKGLLEQSPPEWRLDVISHEPWQVLETEKNQFGLKRGQNLALWQPPLLPFGNRYCTLPLRRYLTKAVYPKLVSKRKLNVMNFTDSIPWGKVPVAKAEIMTALDFYYYTLDPTRWEREREALQRRSDQLWVAAISDFTAREASYYMGIPSERVRTLYLAVDHQIYNSSATEEDAWLETLDLPENYILYVGAWFGRKNLATLLKALQIKGNLGGEGIPLVLAGAHGHATMHEKKEIDLQIATLSQTSPVIDLGILTDEKMAAVYRRAMMLVHPAVFEGFGFTILEAMACEIPVICGKTSSLQEVGGPAAHFLENVLDEEEMLHAIKQIAGDSRLQATMRKRGRNHAARFTWERFEKGIVDLNRAAMSSTA